MDLKLWRRVNFCRCLLLNQKKNYLRGLNMMFISSGCTASVCISFYTCVNRPVLLEDVIYFCIYYVWMKIRVIFKRQKNAGTHKRTDKEKIIFWKIFSLFRLFSISASSHNHSLRSWSRILQRNNSIIIFAFAILFLYIQHKL